MASTRPRMPLWVAGLPVTQASALMSSGNIRRYSSAIHAISRGPVPTSGAGTLTLGLMKCRRASSRVNARVIASNSSAVYFAGSRHSPPFDPPNGTSTTAHLYDMRAARASTSSWSTTGAYRMPPLVGSRCSLWTARQPTNT